MSTKTYQFGIKDTASGATAWMIAPSGRKITKRFRNSYASGRSKANTWIDNQIAVINECVEIEGWTPPNIVREE